MPLSLLSMREILEPGIWLMMHSDDAVALQDVPQEFKHLRAVFDYCGMSRIGDFQRPFKNMTVGGAVYETKLVLVGREYPQGWGRGPGGAAAEPPPEPDGKVDVFQQQDNANLTALKDEVQRFYRDEKERIA